MTGKTSLGKPRTFPYHSRTLVDCYPPAGNANFVRQITHSDHFAAFIQAQLPLPVRHRLQRKNASPRRAFRARTLV